MLGLGLSCAFLAALASDKRTEAIATVLWAIMIGGLAMQVVKHLSVVPRPAAVLGQDLST